MEDEIAVLKERIKELEEEKQELQNILDDFHLWLKKCPY